MLIMDYKKAVIYEVFVGLKHNFTIINQNHNYRKKLFAVSLKLNYSYGL